MLQDPVNWTDRTGLSTDVYTPDPKKHGGAHVDRRTKQGQHVGRYRPDGSPIQHKGRTPPPIPKSDLAKFARVAAKLPLIGVILGILLDADEANAGEEELLRQRLQLKPEDSDPDQLRRALDELPLCPEGQQ